MDDKKIQALMPSAIAVLIRSNREMLLVEFERVYGNRMTEAMTQQGYVEVREVMMKDRSNKVPPRLVKMIFLLKS